MAVGTLPSRTVGFDVEVPAPAAERSRVWSKLVRNPAAIAGALVLLVVIVAALGADWLAPHDPAKQSLIRRFTPPVWQTGGSAAYPLGTD
jgi:dipeptide transport system permease protein